MQIAWNLVLVTFQSILNKSQNQLSTKELNYDYLINCMRPKNFTVSNALNYDRNAQLMAIF